MGLLQMSILIENKFFAVAELMIDEKNKLIDEKKCLITPSEEFIEYLKEEKPIGFETYSADIGDIVIELQELALNPNSELYKSEEPKLKFKLDSQPRGNLLRNLEKD